MCSDVYQSEGFQHSLPDGWSLPCSLIRFLEGVHLDVQPHILPWYFCRASSSYLQKAALRHCHLDVFWQLSPWEHKHHEEVNTFTCITQNRKTKHKYSLIQSLQHGMPWELPLARGIQWYSIYWLMGIVEKNPTMSTLFFNTVTPHVNGTLSFKYNNTRGEYFYCTIRQMAGKLNVGTESHLEVYPLDSDRRHLC